MPALTDRPIWVHRLAVAVRFVDVFTRVPIRTPLRVWASLPPGIALFGVVGERWPAVRRESDDTYRFVVTNEPVPTLQLAVQVEAPLGEYVSDGPILLPLPRPRTPPPPPARAGDFLSEVLLFPTPRFRPPGGETIVLGRVVSTGGTTPVAGLSVLLFRFGVPVTVPLFTRTDAAGEFLYRLPDLRFQGATTTAALDIELRDAASALVPVTNLPAGGMVVPLGRLTIVEFTVV